MMLLLGGDATTLTIAGGEAVSLATVTGGLVSTGYTAGAEPAAGGADEFSFVVIDGSTGATNATITQPTTAASTGVIDASWEPQWSDVGSGSITLPYDSAHLTNIDYGDIIRCVYRGLTVFSWIATTRTSDTVPVDGDYGNVTWDGPGRLAALSGVRIHPSRGFGAKPIEETRSYGWASVDYDDSYWGDTSISLGYAGTPTAYWYGLANWPDLSTEWMWVSGSSTSWAPTGDCYFRKTFTVTTEDTYEVAFAADDRGELYIDGQRIITTGDWDNTTGSINTVDVALTAGTHNIAIWAQNNDGQYGNNPAGVLVRIGNLAAGTIFNSGAGWTALAYPIAPPGVTLGDALIKIITAAQTNGSIPGMAYDFTATTDSHGQPWPYLDDVTAPVGSDLLEMLLRYVDSGDLDVMMSAGSYTLHAYVGGNGGYARSTTLAVPSSATDPTSGNLLTLEHKSEHRVANAAVIRYDGGWAYLDQSGSDPVEEIELDYGHITSSAEAERVAATTLTDLANVREQITAEVQPRTGEWPWHHYAEGDTITVPTSSGSSSAQRVMSIAAKISGDELTIVPTLKDRIAEGFERHERWLKAMADGAARGQSNVASRPKLPPVSVPATPIATQTWSLPVWGVYTGGAWTVPTSVQTRRAVFSLDSAATGTRTAIVRVDGVAIATLSISSGSRVTSTNIETRITYGSVVDLGTLGAEAFGGNVTLEYLPG